jgi:hypothetical protein
VTVLAAAGVADAAPDMIHQRTRATATALSTLAF